MTWNRDFYYTVGVVILSYWITYWALKRWGHDVIQGIKDIVSWWYEDEPDEEQDA